MFDDLIKQLKKLEQEKFSIPIEVDEKGYLDRQCPSSSCGFSFKVHGEDWRNIVRDEAVWCPLCRHEEKADKWLTSQHLKHIQEEARTVIKGALNRVLKSGADKFNRAQSRGGFVSISIKVQGDSARTYVLPAPAAESMQLEIQCECCNARFAVVGSAYFCPACGHNSVTRMFSDSLRKIEAKKENIDLVRNALTEVGKVDEAELTCRSLLESCIQDGVVAFQKYCDELYKPFASVEKPPFNVFQRLRQSGDLWRSAIGHGYDNWLTNSELTELEVLYQKRHLLAHKEGIVDESYIKNSGDSSYKVGQRIVINTADVERLLECLRKLSAGLSDVVKTRP